MNVCYDKSISNNNKDIFLANHNLIDSSISNFPKFYLQSAFLAHLPSGVNHEGGSLLFEAATV